MDDLASAATEDSAFHLFNALLGIIRSLGLQPSTTPGNIVPPAEIATILGVEYNLKENTVSLPPDKLADVLELLQVWQDRSSATNRQIKQLTGKLLYCSRVVGPGRLFLGRMLQTSRNSARLDEEVNLDANFHLD